MNLHTVQYVGSFGTFDQLPSSTLPEIAFVGRSNVGKSSLLNKLFNRRGLAKVSQKPGKTATINFFCADTTYFVDLPGYGYAQVPKKDQIRWAELIEGYFNEPRHLALVCVLIDIRHPAFDLDETMVHFLVENTIPFALVATKGDKLAQSKRHAQMKALRTQLNLEDATPLICTSSTKGFGIEQLRNLIDEALHIFQNDAPESIKISPNPRQHHG